MREGDGRTMVVSDTIVDSRIEITNEVDEWLPCGLER